MVLKALLIARKSVFPPHTKTQLNYNTLLISPVKEGLEMRILSIKLKKVEYLNGLPFNTSHHLLSYTHAIEIALGLS